VFLEQVLDRWWRLVAFKKARNLLHQAMLTVLHRCTATAIKMVSKVDAFCIIVLFAVAASVLSMLAASDIVLAFV